MITKFEKRVLAFMLAGLLCVPVTAVPSVTANAEEVESTVQQDDQQTGEEDAQTSTSETQQPASENQEDESSGGETGNDLSDGAFVPIEEEQDETQQNGEQEVNENKETQTKNHQEEEEQKKTATQKTAANNLSDEELEEVTLGENGEPVRMTTEIAESEEAVRYLFLPKESGSYYIDLLGTGSFSVHEKTEYGSEQWIDSASSDEYEYGSAVFELEAGATYYIDIRYDYSGTAGVVNWKLGRPQDITPGEYEAVISEPGERVHYRLVYGESDIYYFNIDDNDAAYFHLNYGDSGSLFSGSSYEKFNKDDKCYIDIFFYGDLNTTGNVSWEVAEMEVQTAVEGEVIRAPQETGDQGCVYSFIPQTSGKYRIICDSVSVYDESWFWIGNDVVALEAGKTYYLLLNFWNDEFEWSVNKSEEIEIQENETIYTEAGTYDHYKFVPAESGYYAVSEGDAELYDSDWNRIYNDRWQLSEGEIYYIVINADSNIQWSIERSEEILIQEGETVHTEKGEIDYYKFVPTESGRYYLSSYSAQLYDSEWNSMYGQNHELTAGSTYYITVSSYSDVDWSISKLEEVEISAGNTYRVLAEDSVYFKFVPNESCQYSIPYRLDVYDSEWNQIWDTNLEAGATYYLMVDSNDNFYFRIDKAEVEETEELTVQCGGSYVTSPEQQIIYTFIPEESGRYHFWSDEEAYIKASHEPTQIYGFDYWGDFEAGEKYTIKINFPSSADWDVHWHIGKAETLRITEGTDYTSNLVQSQEYAFVPEKTGYYFISSDDTGECSVYDSSRNELMSHLDDIYDYIDEDGFGAVVYMEAEQKYYIHIIPEKEEATWQINPVEKEEDYVYRILSDGKVQILKYTGEESAVNIPSSIAGKDVESIGYGAFGENNRIQSVTIPDKVTELQYGAFISCKNLQTVTLTEGSELESIGNMAFRHCESLTDINLPDSVREIEANAFYYCTNLSDINLGSELKEIGDNAFYNSGVSEVDLPDSLTELGESAFASCVSLENVTIGSGLEGIPNGAFNGCENISAVEFPANITYIGSSAFNGTGIEKLNIPDTILSVDTSAFSYCDSLKEVKIGSKVTYIADGVFAGCDLRQITIDGELESIGDSSFLNNKNLESIEIPSSVTRIEYRAFSGCSSLLEIEIPDSVEAIAGCAFDGATDNMNTAWYNNQDDGVVYAGKVLYKYKGEAPEGTTITVEDGTKGIAGYAFCWQSNLKEIQLSDTLTNIGDYAFYACESMKEIHIPQSVTEIGEYALGYLDDRSTIKVPGFTIYGVAGTAAEVYAKENGFTFTAVEPEVMLGDVDESGKVDISDLRLVLRAVCGKVTLTSTQKLAADVEKDNNVDIQDLRKILRYVCHKIDSFE